MEKIPMLTQAQIQHNQRVYANSTVDTAKVARLKASRLRRAEEYKSHKDHVNENHATDYKFDF